MYALLVLDGYLYRAVAWFEGALGAKAEPPSWFAMAMGRSSFLPLWHVLDGCAAFSRHVDERERAWQVSQ